MLNNNTCVLVSPRAPPGCIDNPWIPVERPETIMITMTSPFTHAAATVD